MGIRLNNADVDIRGAEITFTRVYDAPRELVFRAWTDPVHLAQWWGPKDFTNPVCKLDLRAGGEYRITMRGPDGTDYPMGGRFLEVEPPAKLVMSASTEGHPDEFKQQLADSRGNADSSELQLVFTILFEDLGGKTRLTVINTFRSTTDLEAASKLGHNEGWTESLERLQQELELMA